MSPLSGLLKAYFTETAEPVKGRSSRVVTPSIEIDGEYSSTLVDLIKDVQSGSMGMKRPDGRIDPYGMTIQTITSSLRCTGSDAKTILFGPVPGNEGILRKGDSARFRKLFGKQLGLTVTKGGGSARLLRLAPEGQCHHRYPVGSLHACYRLR